MTRISLKSVHMHVTKNLRKEECMHNYETCPLREMMSKVFLGVCGLLSV